MFLRKRENSDLSSEQNEGAVRHLLLHNGDGGVRHYRTLTEKDRRKYGFLAANEYISVLDNDGRWKKYREIGHEETKLTAFNDFLRFAINEFLKSGVTGIASGTAAGGLILIVGFAMQGRINMSTTSVSVSWPVIALSVYIGGVLGYRRATLQEGFPTRRTPRYLLPSVQGQLRNESRYSEVDPSRIITDGHWLISLVRKPDGAHSEHAFLILEGKESNIARIWFMDFVGEPMLPGINDGKIRLEHFEGALGDKLLLSCKLRMMDITRGSRLLFCSWAVPSEAALQLVRSVKGRQLAPPKFNILGCSSVFASSTAGSSSKSVGHNCYTWAREQLNNLEQSHIIMSDKDSIVDSAFSQTSRVLPDPQMLSWYQKPIGVAGIAITAAVVGVTIARKKSTKSQG